MHQLRLYVDKTNIDSKNIYVHDLSIYDELLDVLNPRLQCKSPLNDTYIIVPFAQSGISVINSETLQFTDAGDALIDVPDGYYSLFYSVSPHAKLQIYKTLYLTNRLRCKWLQLVSTICDVSENDVDPLGNIVKNKNANVLLFVSGLLDNCEYLGNTGNNQMADYYYNKADKLLSLISIKY